MRIHMLGIGGTGMGSLAALFKEAGHTVTGTDGPIYPPMSDHLASLSIVPFVDYRAENVAKAAPDLAIIGNVIRRDNPEAQEVMRRGIPYRSMPAALAEFFLADRTPLIIAGTHGKTSSATLATWLLQSIGEAPGFLIGGIGKNLGKSSAIGKPPFFVVEGDEYDSAFFDKGPKFLHYRPQALLLTSIEFDHADIYQDVEAIRRSFERLVQIVPPDGVLVVNAEDARAVEVAKLASCRIVTYATEEDADYLPTERSVDANGASFLLAQHPQRFWLPMWGKHNLSNAVGVLALLAESGINLDRAREGLSRFEGIRRRQELLGEIGGIAVIDDFAHHPTAVAMTIQSMRERFPDRRIWAIFEPRSNTSRRNVFQKEYARALAQADRVIIASPYRGESIPKAERFDSQSVADAIMRSGTDAHHIDTIPHIVEFIMRAVNEGDVLLLMSNGGFGGIHTELLTILKKRRTS